MKRQGHSTTSFNNDQPEFSRRSFWEKVKSHAKEAGREVLTIALKLYYCAQDPETPQWAKITIYGALAYFIAPLDAIPDVTPLVGYTDDLGALAAAAATVVAHVKPQHTRQAKHTLKEWFG
jgi:uncharacterized membrane protein YkvA (DUF1232 family)